MTPASDNALPPPPTPRGTASSVEQRLTNPSLTWGERKYKKQLIVAGRGVVQHAAMQAAVIEQHTKTKLDVINESAKYAGEAAVRAMSNARLLAQREPGCIEALSGIEHVRQAATQQIIAQTAHGLGGI